MCFDDGKAEFATEGVVRRAITPEVPVVDELLNGRVQKYFKNKRRLVEGIVEQYE